MRMTMILAIVLLALVGCKRSGNGTTVTSSPAQFTLDADYVGEWDEDWFTWQSDFDQAEVDLRIRGFDSGLVRIRVYDDTGFKVLDEIYFDFQADHGGELEDFFLTALGDYGEWQVRVEYENFTGHLYFVLK